MNVVVKHKKEHFPNIPIHYFSNKESIIDKMTETYFKGEKSYIFVSSTLVLKNLYQRLCNSVNDDDIYTWHSKQKVPFSSQKAKSTKICIFINKGTTGINDLDLNNIFIFRNLSAKSTSSRDMENKDISNICLQIMGRLRKNGNVYWYGDKINDNRKKNSNLFSLTESYYKYALSSKVAKIHHFGRQIIKKQYTSDFENYFIRPFIFAFIWQKHWDNPVKTEEKSVLEVMSKFKKDCKKIYEKMENCIFKEEFDETTGKMGFMFINNDTGKHFHFVSEYLYLEEKIISSYKKTICESYSSEYEKFFV